MSYTYKYNNTIVTVVTCAFSRPQLSVNIFFKTLNALP